MEYGKLHYRASGVGGKPPCPVVRAAIATKPWIGENDFAITEDAEVFNQNIPLGADIQTIKVSETTLAKWYLGQQPNPVSSSSAQTSRAGTRRPRAASRS